jgi:hypothetical protein
MINHLRQHWHHHLALWGSAAALAILLTGVGTAAALILHFKGGFRPGHLPPRVTIAGGTVPSSVSLAGSVVRIHNQGTSSSCVGQTLSTIAEIVSAERNLATRLSAGFIYDQANGGQDNGTSWTAAFAVLTGQGDAPLSVFPHDGQDWWVQPDSAALAAARPYRFWSWRSIDPTDRHTIESELAAGRALGLAIPVHDSFYYHACTVPLSSDTGAFWFWHALTVIGYSPTGIRVLNSWGPSWGCNGQGTVTWDLLSQYAGQGASVVVGYPPSSAKPVPKPQKHPGKTPIPPGMRSTAIPRKTPTTRPPNTPLPPTIGPVPTPTPRPLVLHGTHCNAAVDLRPAGGDIRLTCHFYHLLGTLH